MAIDPGEGTRLADVREAHRFDEAALEAWLSDRLPDTEGRLRVRQFGYGQSNPTFVLGWPNAEYVLRKKPPGELLPSAHAVDRNTGCRRRWPTRRCRWRGNISFATTRA